MTGDREVFAFITQLKDVVYQLWMRTGGGDDSISRIESETLFDVGIKGAEIAEIAKQQEAFMVVMSALDRLTCEAEEFRSQISDLQAQITESEMLRAEIIELTNRVSDLENGNNS